MKLHEFARESNKIEGIHSQEADNEMFCMLSALLGKGKLTAPYIIKFAKNLDGKLRDKEGMNVRVGTYFPLKGGSEIRSRLEWILDSHVNTRLNPFTNHCLFEKLHPFTDGNGRTGRAIWLWQMVKQKGYDMELGFLQMFYYQTLE